MRNYFTASVAVFLMVSTLVVLPELELFRLPQSWMHSFIDGFSGKISGYKNYQSDGAGIYFSLFLAALFSAVAGWMLSSYATFLRTLAYRWTVFFLVLILVKYGTMKVNFEQFYYPDPNTLDTRFGALSKDTVYWSLVGSSPAYQLFLGISELLTAGLLLFRRTRFVGLLLSVAVFTNVVAVNYCFDISVKLLSLTCLTISLLLLLFHLHALGQMVQVNLRSLEMPPRSSMTLWILGMVVLLSEDVLPVLVFDNPHEILHTGSYQLANNHEKFYIHRSGYVILTENKRLNSYPVYRNSKLFTTFIHGNHIDSVNWEHRMFSCADLSVPIFFSAEKRNDRLVQRSFHWTSDEFH